MRLLKTQLRSAIRRVIRESMLPSGATREDLIQLISDYTEDGEEQSYEVTVMEFVDFVDDPSFTEEMAEAMLDDLLSEPDSPIENVGGLIMIDDSIGGDEYYDDDEDDGNDYAYQQGAVGQVHFPSDVFDIGELEDMMTETPSPAAVIDQDPEYVVQGNIEELRFIWTEINSRAPGLSFDDHIIERF